MNLMADLCVNLVPLFNALPQDEKMQIEKLVQHKNKGGKYIAYFQNFTNTYGDAQKLIDKYR